jgi:hypothetical protein
MDALSGYRIGETYARASHPHFRRLTRMEEINSAKKAMDAPWQHGN